MKKHMVALLIGTLVIGGCEDGDKKSEDFYLTLPIPEGVHYVVSATWRQDYGYGPHMGIDYDVPTGTTIIAPAPGEVIYAGHSSGGGETVLISHSHGFYTETAHLGSLSVQEGQRLSRGDVIGTCGTIPSRLGRPHIHMSLRRLSDNEDIDPQPYIR